MYDKMKECLKCKNLKNLTEFFKDKNRKDGYSTLCKICQKENNKLRYNLKKDEIKTKTNEYYHKNKEKLKNKYIKNTQKYKINNPNYDKIYYQNNKDKINDNYKLWKLKNQDKIKKYNIEYKKQWNKKNKHIQLWISILSRYLKTNKYIKNKNTLDELKFDYNKFKENITSKFEDWMNWENYGDWELHHNIPLSWFKENTPSYIPNDLRNLYPLLTKENRKIKNKLIKFDISTEYLSIAINWIKDDYKPNFNTP